MYKIKIGEISRQHNEGWLNNNETKEQILDTVLVEKECDMGTLSLAAKTFRDEVQLDWGVFAWKAFKSDIKKLFRRKGFCESDIEELDPYKEYGVVYIDN